MPSKPSVKHGKTAKTKGRREFAIPGLKPASYQPSQAELEEEFDMPGADIDTLRKAFFGDGKPVGKSDS